MKNLPLLLLFLIALLPGHALAATATILPPAETQFSDANGAPYASGKIYFYIPNTTTPKNTWQDAGETTLNTNPVTLDSAGRALIYGQGQYSEALYDQDGNLVYNQLTQDVHALPIILPTQANNTVLGNNSGGTASPTALTASQVLAMLGNVQGELLYSNGINWTVLPPGSAGQFLATGGPGSNPSWTSSTTPTQSNNTVLGNNSGGVASPSPLTASNVLDMLCSAQGSLLYRDTSGTGWHCLAPGTNGQVLTTQGAAANPIWGSALAGSQAVLTGGTNQNPIPQGATTFMWNGQSSGEGNVYVPLPAGTFSSMVVIANSPLPSGESAVFTFRQSGAPTTITCTMTGGTGSAGECADVVHTASTGAILAYSISVLTSAAAGSINYQFSIKESTL